MALPNDKVRLREILAGLTGHGRILLVVNQSATFGALPAAVARAAGAAVGYLPGLAMRRIADLHQGQAETDAKDAAIIAEAARSMPHTLRTSALGEETLAELGVLCKFYDDLAARITALLTVAAVITCNPPGPGLPGRGGPAYPVPDSGRAEGRRPRTCLGQRDAIAARVEALVEAHPLYQVLTSMPSVGTCARILTEVTGKHFASAAHLASYAKDRAGHAPLRNVHPGRTHQQTREQKLKRALFLSAFAALHHPPSRAYYNRKRAEGNATTKDLTALTRRRPDVLFAMLRNGAHHQDQAHGCRNDKTQHQPVDPAAADQPGLPGNGTYRRFRYGCRGTNAEAKGQ